VGIGGYRNGGRNLNRKGTGVKGFDEKE